jgi:hypothetical protein
MANTAISALPTVTTPLAGTEVLPIVQSSSTKRVTIAEIASYIGGSSYTLPVASASVLGGVKQGTNIIIDANGVISASASAIVTSTTTITSPLVWTSNSYDQYILTGLANALTINADSSTPVDGQKMVFRFKDNGTAQALTWTTGASKAFRAVGVTLPTTTVVSKTLYIGCIYNAADLRWDVIAVAQEA